MIPAEMPGWVIALPLLTITIIDILWGFDLMLAEATAGGRWWHVFIRSGSFWLGVRFLLMAICLPGVLGIIFLFDPQAMRPTWFGVAMIAVAVVSVLAWWFLSLTNTANGEDDL